MTEARKKLLHAPNIDKATVIAKKVICFIGVVCGANFWKYSCSFVIRGRGLFPEELVLCDDKIFNISWAGNPFVLRFEGGYLNKLPLKGQRFDLKKIYHELVLFSPKHRQLSLWQPIEPIRNKT